MRLAFFVFLLGGLLLQGCASVSVHPESATAHQSQAQAPQKIIVSNFSFEGAKVNADREGEEMSAFQKQVADDLSKALCKSIGKLGLPAEKGGIDRNASTPQPAWLVQGRFLRINQGSRAMRVFFGCGAGGTKMETAVEVYDLSVSDTVPAFTFTTTGGSGATPGALINPNAIGVGLAATGRIAQGVSDDSKRTARMISAYLSQMLVEHGYLSPDKAKKAKIHESATT